MPAALKKAKPGTPEFREALRDALENVKNVVGTHGVYNMTAKDHNGLDSRARVLVARRKRRLAADEVARNERIPRVASQGHFELP